MHVLEKKLHIFGDSQIVKKLGLLFIKAGFKYANFFFILTILLLFDPKMFHCYSFSTYVGVVCLLCGLV